MGRWGVLDATDGILNSQFLILNSRLPSQEFVKHFLLGWNFIKNLELRTENFSAGQMEGGGDIATLGGKPVEGFDRASRALRHDL